MPTIHAVLNQGVEHHQRGQLDAAERCYRQVLEADARNADAWHLLGLVAHARGEAATAIDHIQRAIALDGRQASFHHHLAEVYRSLARFDEAEASCRQAIALKEDFAAAHCALGLVFQQQRRSEEAVDCFRRAAGLDPQLAIAHYQLGDMLVELRQTAEAARCFQRAAGCAPTMAEAHFRLGVLMQSHGRATEAIACYENALRARADYALAYNNLGLIYKTQGDLDRAAECYAKALAAEPELAEAQNNLGNVLKLQGRLDAARDCYQRTLQIDSQYAQARYNLGLLALAEGDYTAGWPLYAWRRACPEFAQRAFDEPRWQGEALTGRTLLVYAEQGLGDTLQFVRFGPPVAQRGASVVLEVPRALIPLLEQSGFGETAQLVAAGEVLPRFDVQVPLLGLPGVLGTTLETIPAAGGYLSADRERVERWRGVLGQDERLRVGIAWQGTATHAADRLRSMRLAEFAPLALANVELVSLQKGFGAEQVAQLGGRFEVRELGPTLDRDCGAFMDTAAVMQCLDLVVTCDTAVAHLAGGLGIAVWVALPLVPDWRWMLRRDDSPWYASMRLFRQTTSGDWGGVFAEIGAALRQFTQAH